MTHFHKEFIPLEIAGGDIFEKGGADNRLPQALHLKQFACFGGFHLFEDFGEQFGKASCLGGVG